jgi:hypothetical protein
MAIELSLININKKARGGTVPPRGVAGFLLLGATKKPLRSPRAFQTSHNGTVHAPPPLATPGFTAPRSATPPTACSPTFGRAVLLRKSLYARPNVVYRRNVRRNCA